MAPTPKKKIILIDDDHGPMDYYVEALRMKGFDVEHIDSADKAYDLFELNSAMTQPDLFVIDHMMPYGSLLDSDSTNAGMNTGLLLIQRCLAKFPEAKVFCLTNIRPSNIKEGLPDGVICFPKYENSPMTFSAKIVECLNPIE